LKEGNRAVSGAICPSSLIFLKKLSVILGPAAARVGPCGARPAFRLLNFRARTLAPRYRVFDEALCRICDASASFTSLVNILPRPSGRCKKIIEISLAIGNQTRWCVHANAAAGWTSSSLEATHFWWALTGSQRTSPGKSDGAVLWQSSRLAYLWPLEPKRGRSASSRGLSRQLDRQRQRSVRRDIAKASPRRCCAAFREPPTFQHHDLAGSRAAISSAFQSQASVQPLSAICSASPPRVRQLF
jgi:hypothetical protein